MFESNRACRRLIILRSLASEQKNHLLTGSPQIQEIFQFIDAHQVLYGVEPICRVFKIAPSTYYRCKALEAKPEHRCQRFHQDEALKPEILRLWQENRSCYGVRKVWKQMKREHFTVARCTAAKPAMGRRYKRMVCSESGTCKESQKRITNL